MTDVLRVVSVIFWVRQGGSEVIREPFQVTQRKVPVALLWEGQQAEVVERRDQQLCLIGAEALG